MDDAAAPLHIKIQRLCCNRDPFTLPVELMRRVFILVDLPHRKAHRFKELPPVQPVPCHFEVAPVHLFQRPHTVEHLVFLQTIRRRKRFSGFRHQQVITDRDLCPVPPGVGEQCLVHLRGDAVIAVHKTDPFPARSLHPGVPRSGTPGVLLVDDPDARVARCCFLAQRRAVVRGAVVYEKEFKVPEGLRQNGIHTFFEVGFRFIDRDNDADGRFCHRLSLLSSNRFAVSLFRTPAAPRCGAGR